MRLARLGSEGCSLWCSAAGRSASGCGWRPRRCSEQGSDTMVFQAERSLPRIVIARAQQSRGCFCQERAWLLWWQGQLLWSQIQVDFEGLISFISFFFRLSAAASLRSGYRSHVPSNPDPLLTALLSPVHCCLSPICALRLWDCCGTRAWTQCPSL